MGDIVMLVAHPSNEIEYISEATFTMLDFKQEQTALPFEVRSKLLQHPEDAHHIVEYYKRFTTLKDDEENYMEYRARAKSGEWIWLAVRGHVFRRDGQGNATHSISIAHDITWRKNIEHELLRVKDELAQQATDKYLALFNSIDEAFCILEMIYDENGRVLDYRYADMNPAFEKQSGMKNAQGKTLSELVPGIETSWVERAGKVAETGESIRFEDYVAPMQRWFEVYLFRVNNSKDYVAKLFYDITDRKKAEEFSRQNEEKQIYLLKLSDAIRPLARAEDIQYQASCTLGKFLGANRVGYAEDQDDNDTIIVTRNYVNNSIGIEGKYRYDDYGKSLMKDLASGKTVVRNNIEQHLSLTTEEKEAHRILEIGASVNIPLVKEGKLIAVLFVHYKEAHTWTENELVLMEETAQRTWAAVERARAEQALKDAEEIYLAKLEEQVKQRTFELNESKNLLQSVFDGSPNTISVLKAIYDAQGEILNFEIIAANRQVKKNNKGENPVGFYFTDYYPEILETDIFDAFKKVMKTSSPIDIERYYKGGTIDGWYRIVIVKLNDMIIVSGEDISQRKKAEEELTEAYTLMELKNKVYNYAEVIAHMGTWTWEPVTNHTFYSDNMYRLFGLEPGEIGLNIEIIPQFVHPEDRQALIYKAGQLKEGNQPVTSEYRVIRKDGEERNFINRVNLVRYKNENIVVGITEDITDRKRYDLELKDSSALMRSVFDTSLIQMSVLKAVRNVEGEIEDFRIMFANKELEKETGRKDLVGKLYAEEFPGIKASGLFGSIVQAVESGEPVRLEYFYPFEDFNKWYSCMFVKAEDGVVATNLDITERKQAEQSLMDLKLRQQKEILNAIIHTQEEERERIGEDLHNGVAQLLYGIQTRLELLNGSASDALYLQQLTGIVKQAIEDTRRISFELVPSVLKEYGIEVAVKSLYRRIASDLLQVNFQFAKLQERLPEKIEFSVYRIIQELLNNILKHSKADRALITFEAIKNNLYLNVYDNGIGFDEKLLSPMNKGIGLQTVKNRINLLDGTLRVNSIPGKTHFAVIIPLKIKEN
jgi:PAS domain S-box-containing protein